MARCGVWFEQFLLWRKDRHNCRYIFSILYTSDEELDRIIYDEILAEAEHTADMRNCFIEVDIISMDDPERGR